MSEENNKIFLELKRIRRVSDMMITAHSLMTENFLFLSRCSDLLLFSCSLLLTVIVFADSAFLIKYLGNNYSLGIGIFSILTFIFSFLATQLNWKVRAERHRYACDTYKNLKFTVANLINRVEINDHVDVEKFLEKYYNLTSIIIAIPERSFLRCKRKHAMKLQTSKYLDEHPNTSLLCLKIKLWCQDNLGRQNK